MNTSGQIGVHNLATGSSASWNTVIEQASLAALASEASAAVRGGVTSTTKDVSANQVHGSAAGGQG